MYGCVCHTEETHSGDLRWVLVVRALQPDSITNTSRIYSDDALLKSKQYSDQLEPLAIRLERVRKFLLSINPDLEYELVALHEVCGPTATEEDIQALVLSKESAQGGEFSEYSYSCLP